MENEKFDVLGHIYERIGVEASADIGGDFDELYLYVEIGDRWTSVSIFVDEGDLVRYHDGDFHLTDLIRDAWFALAPEKRWSVMEYVVRGPTFDAHFRFPKDVDVETVDSMRREKALRARYGDKPIAYPPLPNDDSLAG